MVDVEVTVKQMTSGVNAGTDNAGVGVVVAGKGEGEKFDGGKGCGDREGGDGLEGTVACFPVEGLERTLERGERIGGRTGVAAG